MSALPEELLAPATELDPGFFSKIFQNFKLSSAAEEELASATIIDRVSLTRCCEHLSIWAETTVENSGLMCWNLNVAHESRVAPNAERIVRETA
jgi:hypothetical protein